MDGIVGRWPEFLAQREIQATADRSMQGHRLSHAAALIRGSGRVQASAEGQLRIDSSPRQTAQRKALPSALAGPTAVIRREPKAVPEKPSEKPLYHITTIENFHSIAMRGGLMPLNWIIEGTHGQKAEKSSLSRGLDAARGEGSHDTMEAHRKEVRAAKEAWLEAKGTQLEDNVARHYADIQLGRKRDFVYGTRRGETLASYRDIYHTAKVPAGSLVVLRWTQAAEAYFKDLEDENALKSLEAVPLDRLQVASAVNLGDATPEALAKLSWVPATNTDLLADAGLLPLPSKIKVPDQTRPPASESLPSIEELEASIRQDEENDDLLIQELEALVEQEEHEEDELISSLERDIENETLADDMLIKQLESELGSDVVEEIDDQIRKETASLGRTQE